MKQREEPHDNEKVHRPHRMATASATRMSISQLLLEHVRRTASRISPPRLLGSVAWASYSLFGIVFVASANVPTIGGHHGIHNARQYGSPGFETLLRDYDIRGRQRPLQSYQYRGPSRGR